jgi:AdoMet-dependent heme synthase
VTAPRHERAPLRVYWELTRACPLACRRCRAEAMPQRAPDELTTVECRAVLDDLTRDASPHVIFTGGDPLVRPDLLDLVGHAVGAGLPVAVAPSATPNLSGAAIGALRDAGVGAMSLSLDGGSAARHDRIRDVLGCFGWTLAAAQRIVRSGIPLPVNTLVSAETEPDLEEIAKVVARLGATRWSLFFLVAVGRGRLLRPLGVEEAERTLRWLAAHRSQWPFVVSTTEAPHYRRVLAERMREEGTPAEAIRHALARSAGVRDGHGILFIGANGDVMPSGFLPVVTGNVRRTSALALYRHHPLFRALRNPSGFHGRCGVCGFRSICGGSRARAYAASGDVLGEDPLCGWVPAALATA